MRGNQVDRVQAPQAAVGSRGRVGEGLPKRAYSPPVLKAYGDLRTFTMGGSPGVGDSGAGQFIQNPLV